jgi:hypothetical protein
MFWNPAGTVLKEGQSLQAAFSYNKWIADLGHNAFAVTFKLGDIGTIGVGAVMFGVNGITAYRDVAPPGLERIQTDMSTTPTYDYMDLALQATYSRQFTDNLALGTTFRYIHEKVDDLSASAIALDLGSIYTIGTLGEFVNDWKLSARLTNIGTTIKYYDVESPIPITFSVGTSFKPFKNQEIGELLLAIDAVKPQDSPQLFFVGAEFTFKEMVSLRGGWKLNYSGTQDNGTTTRAAIDQTIEGGSAGLGVHMTLSDYDVRVDYAFTAMNLLDSVHRITLSVGMK